MEDTLPRNEKNVHATIEESFTYFLKTFKSLKSALSLLLSIINLFIKIGLVSEQNA